MILLVGGPWFPHLLHVPGLVTRHRLAPLVAILTIPSVIALAAGWIVVRRARLGRRLPAVLIALVAVDLLVFNLGVQSTPDPHDASASASATANRLAALLAAQGDGPAGGLHRMAMFDPDRFYAAQANRLGQPDLTILRSLDSVQGYGAVVNERYDAETGTHLQLNLTPSALSGNTLAQLDLGLLVSVPEYFIHLVDNPPGFGPRIANGVRPAASRRPRSVGPAGAGPAPDHPGRRLHLRLAPVAVGHPHPGPEPDPVLRHRPLGHRRHRPPPAGRHRRPAPRSPLGRRHHHHLAGTAAAGGRADIDHRDHRRPGRPRPSSCWPAGRPRPC